MREIIKLSSIIYYIQYAYLVYNYINKVKLTIFENKLYLSNKHYKT